MKLIICLLSALLLISCVAQNNNNAPYVKVSQQEIISSSLINELMGFGLDYNFAKAHQKYGISANNVAVTKINSVYRQVLRNNKVNYKFDVEATNNNDATMNATYTIEYNTKTGNKIVRQWNYHINYSSKDTEQEVDASYALCSEDEILNNTVIVSLLKYGVAYVFEKASEKYGVSDDNVVVYQIDSVEKQDLKTKVNYRFYVHAHNNDGAKMKTNFTIEYRPKTEKKIVRKWWYYVQWKDNTDDVEDEVENEVEPDNEEECVLSLEELDFCEIAEEGAVIGTENVEANLEVSIDVEIELDVDVETTVDDTEYHKVSEKEIQTNAVINECLGVGLDYVWNKAAQKYGVSDDNTQVTQINSVYRQNLKGKTNYKFEIAATNNDDATMTASFTIEYNNQSGQEIVRQWSYSINYQN